MAAAHRISGNPSFLERSCRMALWGMAATEENRIWHQCDARTRYGFRSMVDAPYDTLLAGADYATRGGLPMIGLEHGSSGPSARTGLPPTVALRCWEPTPASISIEAVNRGDSAVSWRLSSQGSNGRLHDLAMSAARTGGTLTPVGDGWLVSLAAGGHARLDGIWAGRGLLQRRDLWQGV